MSPDFYGRDHFSGRRGKREVLPATNRFQGSLVIELAGFRIDDSSFGDAARLVDYVFESYETRLTRLDGCGRICRNHTYIRTGKIWKLPWVHQTRRTRSAGHRLGNASGCCKRDSQLHGVGPDNQRRRSAARLAKRGVTDWSAFLGGSSFNQHS